MSNVLHRSRILLNDIYNNYKVYIILSISLINWYLLDMPLITYDKDYLECYAFQKIYTFVPKCAIGFTAQYKYVRCKWKVKSNWICVY